MKGFFKLLAILLGLLVVILLAAGIYLRFFFDPNAFKPQLTALVEERTGRQLSIEGDIGVSLFPWLALQAGPLVLGNATGFGPEPFARVGRVDARIRLMPLLERRLEIGTLVVEDLAVHLARDAAGRDNWSDLAAAGSSAAPSDQPASASAEPAEGSPAISGFAFAGLELRNAAFTWRDAGTGMAADLSDLNLSTGEIVLGAPINLVTSFRLALPASGLSADLALEGDLMADLPSQRFGVSGGVIGAHLKGSPVPGGELRLAAELQGVVDLSQQLLSVESLALDAEGLVARATLEGERIIDAPSFQGRVSVDSFNADQWLAEALGVKLDSADPKALSAVSLQSDIQATAESVTLSAVRLDVDDSVITGTVSVPDFQGPALRLGILVDKLDLDRYLPPRSESADDAGNAAEGGGEQSAPASLDPLRKLDLKADLGVGSLRVHGLDIYDLELRATAQGGLLEVAPLTAKTAGGRVDIRAGLDVRRDLPGFRLQSDAAGIQLGPLLEQFADNDKLTGTANIQADLRGSGLDADSIKRSLNGEARLQFRDGAVRGFDLIRLIRNGVRVVKGKAPIEPGKVEETEFSAVSASLAVRDGVIDTRDLEATAPLLRLTGQGTVDLPRELIDFRTRAVLVGSLEGQGGRDLEQLLGVPIPVKITGSFAEPKVTPDVEQILQEQAVRELRDKAAGEADEKVDKLQEKLEKKLQDKLGEEESKGLSEQLGSELKKLFR